VLVAGSGDDRLIGGSLQKGGGGNDRLDSQGYRRETGADRMLGGSGDDRLLGDSDSGPGERMDGGPGADELSGADGDDTLDGADGTDNLIGGDGDDSLSGGPGTDTCDQGAGSGPQTGCER
jgi:Ca2+-binding RTX toxin-like protein